MSELEETPEASVTLQAPNNQPSSVEHRDSNNDNDNNNNNNDNDNDNNNNNNNDNNNSAFIQRTHPLIARGASQQLENKIELIC